MKKQPETVSPSRDEWLEKIQPILTVEKRNCNALVFGKKGYGKTSWVRGLLARKKRIIFVDTLEYEYDERDGVIVTSYKEVVQFFLKEPKEFRLVFRSRKEAVSLFRLWTMSEKTVLVIDEVDLYKEEELDILIEHENRGRHHENDLVAITRHPTQTHPELRKHIDSVVSFQQDDVNTMHYLATINKDVAELLPALKIGEVRILTGSEYLQAFYERA